MQECNAPRNSWLQTHQHDGARGETRNSSAPDLRSTHRIDRFAHGVEYRRVVRQRQGGGEILFDYQDVIEEFEFEYNDRERPSRQTIVTERDGRQNRYLFNRFGNMLFSEEYARLGGIPKLVAWHYRYNADGHLIGKISPLGAIKQLLFGRDVYERRFPQGPDASPRNDPNLTQEARRQFDNLLAVVERGRYYDLHSLNMSRGLWAADIFPDVLQTDDQDAIRKFTYEPEFSQPLTVSDPRATRSTDSGFVEDAEYTRRLTTLSYLAGNGFQHFLLAAITEPTATLPDGTAGPPLVTQYADYDANGRVTRLVAPNSLETANEYFQAADGPLQGFLKATTVDPGGFNARVGVERDRLGRVVRLLRPQAFDVNDGRYVSTTEYNDLSQMVRSTSTPPFSIATRFSYDRAGNVSRVEMDWKDAANAPVGALLVRNRYDEESNLREQDTAGGTLAKRTKVVFDTDSRPFLLISPSGRIRKTSFNERSLMAKTIDDFGGINATTRGRYDADGRLIRITDPRGFTTTFSYDARGRLVEREDELGNKTVRFLDKVGNLLAECISEKRGGDAFALLYRREFAHDELGRMTVASASRFAEPPTVTASELSTAFQDTGPGTLLSVRYYYDSAGNISKTEDQDGRQFLSEFDILGRVSKMTDPNGNEVRFRYDKEGNAVRIDRREITRDSATNGITERYFAKTFAYDELNRLIEQKTPAGVTRLAYDSLGNRLTTQDALGNIEANTFDVFGRVTSTVRQLHHYQTGETPIPVTTAYAYNFDDRIVAQTDPLGRTTSFEYDSAGRLAATVLPDGSSDAIGYDLSGHMVSYRDWNGVVRRLEWDASGRNTRIDIDRSGVLPGLTIAGATFCAAEYYGLDRLVASRNDFVSNAFVYESLGGLVKESTSFAGLPGIDPAAQFTTRRELSPTGALARITYPSGRVLIYTRDVLDRVTSVDQVQKGLGYPGDPGTPDTLKLGTAEYEGLQIKRVARANGITTEFGYDFMGRTVEAAHSNGGGRVFTQQTLYDPLHHVVQIVELSEDFQSTSRLAPDSLSRLCQVAEWDSAVLADLSSLAPPSTPLADDLPDLQQQVNAFLAPPAAIVEAYDYDLTGNRTSATAGGTVTPYAANELDEYTAVNGGALLYDANGNVLRVAGLSYAYDHRNQLAEVTRDADGSRTSFIVDCFGRRCAQADSGETKLLLYDDYRVVETYGGSQLALSAVPGLARGEVLGFGAGGRESWLFTDPGGSVRYLFEGAAKRNFYTYDQFGNLRASLSGADENPFRYAGKMALGGTGLYDFVFRAYDPSLGRFLQRDPKRYVDGTNLYTYARNNPAAFSDPLGMDTRSETGPTQAKIGAEFVRRNPTGFTMKVPDISENAKIRAMSERIQDPLDRGVGIRSVEPGTTSRTNDIRRANKGLRDAFNQSLPANQRARKGVRDIDHTVELQAINRPKEGVYSPGADRVRPQDHRVQQSRLNSQQGKQLADLIEEQIQAGVPEDTPAGGVARERDFNKFWNRPGYRTGMRYFGYYNMIGGIGSSLGDFGEAIRRGDPGATFLSGTGATGGMLELGGLAAESSTLLIWGRYIGAPAAVISSGVIGVRIGTNLYQNYVDKEAAFNAGMAVEKMTGSRILGGIVAAGTAVHDAIDHIPEAAWDYAKDTWTYHVDEIDWDRTLKPWKWL